MKRQNISSGTTWESVVGYSRLVIINSQIYVSGTTAVDENGVVIGRNDPYEQARQIILNIQKALRKVGAGLENVVRTRIYVTNMEDWQRLGKAHSEFFGIIRPATTLVEVSRLIKLEILVEIEADAFQVT